MKKKLFKKIIFLWNVQEILKLIEEQSRREEAERLEKLIESRKNKGKALAMEPLDGTEAINIGVKLPSGKRTSRRQNIIVKI